jgi:hypothetical protein
MNIWQTIKWTISHKQYVKFFPTIFVAIFASKQLTEYVDWLEEDGYNNEYF